LPSKSEVSQRIRRPFLLTRGSSDGKSEERTRFAQIERWTERPSIAAAMTDAFDFDSAQLATSDEDQDRAMVLSFLAEALAVSLPKTAEVAAAKKDPRIMGAETRRSLDLALRTLAQRRGLVLLVDDAHFLDRQSASASALSRPEPLPIFTAIFALPSLLEEEAAGRGPWDLRRTLVLDLPPLDPPAARSFVRMVAGQPIRADAVEILAQRAEGNPLYVEHLVRAVIETAVVAPTKGGELSLVGLRGDSEDAERIPPSITAALRARLNVLDPNLLEVLSAAVVFGDVFWAEGVAEAIGRDIEETMIRVDRLVLADFVRRRPATRYPGLTEVELSHQVVRTVVLARLKQRDRRELERAVVGFLRQVGETDAATMAAHLVRAGYRQDAAELYRRAAQRSVDAGDFAAATLLSDEGLLLLESGAVDEITRVRLLGVAAVARNYARDHGRAKEALLSMLGLALRRPSGAGGARGRVARADLDLPEAARFAQAALTRFVELGDRPGSLGAELILAETAEAETDDRAALKGYVRLSIALDPEVQKGELARTMAGLARIALASGDYRTAESRFRSALAYARAAFSVDALASALLGLGTLAQRQGAHQRALSFFEGAERLVPDADLAGELWARRALLEAEMGALEAAESQVEAALSELWRGGTSQAAIVPTLLWAELAICYSGPIGAATAELLSDRLELMSQLAERAAPALVVPFDLLLGHALVVRGESARGLAMSQGALDRFGESGTLRELEAPLLFGIHSESLSRAGRGLPEIARAVTSAVRHLDELLGRLDRGDRGQALARPPLARILERAAELELDVRHDARSHRLSIGGAND
jgi:tetratricopeptide (TPR) repeat protein